MDSMISIDDTEVKPRMKKLLTMLLALCLTFGIAGISLAVTMTDDGAMVVDGNGNEDLPTIQPGISSDPIFPEVEDDEEDEDTVRPASDGPGPTWAPAEVIYFTLLRDSGVQEPVTLISAGTLFSRVAIGQITEIVRTRDLQYEKTGTVTPDKAYAMVNAKKTGYATLHLRGSSKSDVVGRCTTNRIALVLDAGKSYTRVWCEGKVGYLKTSSLIFLPASGDDSELAVLSYKGRITAKAAINIRQNGKNTSRSLDTVPCGSELVVISTSSDGWVEVEVNGWRGWVQEQYVTRGIAIETAALVSPTPAPVVTLSEDERAAESERTFALVYDESAALDQGDRTGTSGSGMK